MSKKEKIVLIVGDVTEPVVKSLMSMKKDPAPPQQFHLLVHKKATTKAIVETRKFFDRVIELDQIDQSTITKSLLPFKDDIIAITCRSEKYIPFFKNVVPHVPYLKTPTSESLEWSTNKLLMRQRFQAYAPEITPKFMQVEDASEVTIKKIEQEIQYPLVIKPSGFAQSMFVTNVFHRDELESGLKRIFAKAGSAAEAYSDKDHYVLVEHMMEGTMYSIDGYVDDKGALYWCPFVHVKTGKEIGFDDFFGYQQMTPVNINEDSQNEGKKSARKAVEALGLKNTTVHVELYRTEDGWRVIEVGPRIGGFRHEMYKQSFGFDHAENDIRIRLGKRPEIFDEVLGYSAMMKIFAKKEGLIVSVTGKKSVQDLDSVLNLDQKLKRGQQAKYAKNGGISVFNISLFNKERPNLLADIRRIEETLKIKTEK
jgi:biotin carboxylase